MLDVKDKTLVSRLADIPLLLSTVDSESFGKYSKLRNALCSLLSTLLYLKRVVAIDYAGSKVPESILHIYGESWLPFTVDAFYNPSQQRLDSWMYGRVHYVLC